MHLFLFDLNPKNAFRCRGVNERFRTQNAARLRRSDVRQMRQRLCLSVQRAQNCRCKVNESRGGVWVRERTELVSEREREGGKRKTAVVSLYLSLRRT